MIYKGALALSILLATNISAMEEQGHCCPKGETTCRCHHNHVHTHDHAHEPATFAPTPPKTAALPTKAYADGENTPDIFISSVSTGAPLASDSSIAKPGGDLDTLIILPVSKTDAAHAVMNKDNETTSEIPTNVCPVKKESVQGKVVEEHENPIDIISFSPVSTSDAPCETFEVEKERFKAVSLEWACAQEYAHFLRSNYKRKISGAQNSKGEKKEIKESDLPPPELENESSQDESSPIESWLEHLLGLKIAKTNLASLLKTI